MGGCPGYRERIFIYYEFPYKYYPLNAGIYRQYFDFVALFDFPAKGYSQLYFNENQIDLPLACLGQTVLVKVLAGGLLHMLHKRRKLNRPVGENLIAFDFYLIAYHL